MVARDLDTETNGNIEIRELSLHFFLDVSAHLYKSVCSSVGPSVRPSIGPTVGPSIGPTDCPSVRPWVMLLLKMQEKASSAQFYHCLSMH